MLLDYDKKEAEVNRGIMTDLNEICDFLVNVLPLSENIVPNLDADRFTSMLIDHLSRCEYFTLPQSQRKLADFLRDCCDAWTGTNGLDQNSLSQIREAVSQQRTSRFDTSALLSVWNQLLRGYLRRDELQDSGTPREFVIGNPPYAHEFEVLRSSLKPAEPMDTRIRSMIVGIPP